MGAGGTTREGGVSGLVRRSRRHLDPGERSLGMRPSSAQNPAHHVAVAALLAAFGTGGTQAQTRHPGSPEPGRLPYRQQVLDLLQQEKAAGRRIALTTAADREIAEAIASYLGLFDEVHASDGQLNLKGANKAAFLAQHFAETGFEYMGDSAADIESGATPAPPTWSAPKPVSGKPPQ